MRAPKTLLAALVLFALVILCGTWITAHAQEGKPQVDYKVVVKPKARSPKNVIYLIDASGSMVTRVETMVVKGELKQYCFRDRSKTKTAISAFRVFAAQGLDDGKLLACTFGNELRTWKRGWVGLPNKTAIDDIAIWASKQAKHDYVTRLAQPLDRAMKAKPRELMVVIVSDGRFYERDDAILTVLKRANLTRTFGGRPACMVSCVGVDGGSPTLEAIARAGGGAYITVSAVTSRTRGR